MRLELAGRIHEVVRTLERPGSSPLVRGYIELTGLRVLARAEGSMKPNSKRARDDEVTQAAVDGVVKVEAADSVHLGHSRGVHQQRCDVALHVQQLRLVPHSQSRSCLMALSELMRVSFLGMARPDEVADKADCGSRAASMCDTV